MGLGGFQAFPGCQSAPRDPELQLGPLRVLELHTLVLPKELGVWAGSSRYSTLILLGAEAVESEF